MEPTVPPHSMKVTRKRNKVIVRVHVHRIPEKFLNVFVDKSMVKVDTLTWSKKLQLQ
jgi:hypothetical protein|eukprot:COSAG01_NODE_2024_length_8608_cov_32.124574_11_plen_57_part_00